MVELCPDCGRLCATTAHEQATDRYCWSDTGCLRAQVHNLTTRLAASEAKLVEAERDAKLYRKGYEARGKILAAYRTGGRPSEKALSDAAEVAGFLDKAGG
jgi:hypothetical protein